MTEQFEETMQKTARNINVGYLSALFDMAIECIAKIAVDECISGAIHKAINPTLDDMIGQLHSMKNNTMATMMFEGGEETKVVQPEEVTEKSEKVNESQFDFSKPCPFCMHTTLLEMYSKDRQRVAEYLWEVLLNDLYEIAQDTEDHKEIWVLDHRVRKFIRMTREKEYDNKVKE